MQSFPTVIEFKLLREQPELKNVLLPILTEPPPPYLNNKVFPEAQMRTV